MRVSGKNSSVGTSQGTGVTKGGALSSARLSGATAVQPTHQVGGIDALQVSPSAQLLAVAQSEIAKVPDIRIDKVEALRAKLDADSYFPDGEAVADGLIREHSPVPSRP